MWLRWLSQRDTWFWLAIALLVRGAYFWLFLHEHGLHGAWYGWGAETGDTSGYFEPIDSFLAGNAYRPDHRMPGYGLPYLLFRSFTTMPGAGTLIVFAQFLLGVLSVVVLARCARLLNAPRWAQYATCIAFACFGRVAIYDVFWFTESFCTSAMIIAMHGLLAHLRTTSVNALLWSGTWMAWAVFLRPVQAVWLALLAFSLLLLLERSLPKKAALCALFVLPFLVADGLWMRRNWTMHRTLHPLSRGNVMPELAASPMYPLMRFLQATGGNYIHWDPTAHIRWLNMREGLNGAQGKRKDLHLEMPAFALSRSISADSLTLLALDMKRYGDPVRTPAERYAIRLRITERCDRFITYYADEEPWQHQVMARLRMTRLFFNRAGSAGLFADPPKRPGAFIAPLETLDKIMHWGVLVGGLLAAIRCIWKWRRDPQLVVIATLTLIGVFLFPWALRLCEGRYLIPLYPWLLLILVVTVSRLAVPRVN
jgi:hypothetical protein